MRIENLTKEGLRELKAIRTGTTLPLDGLADGIRELSRIFLKAEKIADTDIENLSNLSTSVDELCIPRF